MIIARLCNKTKLVCSRAYNALDVLFYIVLTSLALARYLSLDR